MAYIEKRAKGQYRASIRRKGQPARSATFDTRAKAEAWAREIEAAMDGGRPVQTQEAARTTLREALERYLREVTPGKRGAGPERVRIRAWLAEPIANRPLAAIRGADLAEYRDRRLAAGKSPNSVRLELAIISNLYTVARTEWRLEGLANPVQSIRRPKPGKPRDRRLRAGEEALLLGKADPVFRAAIILAIETGMRRGELSSLQRDQVDRARRIAHLSETKNGDSRDVPLTPRALDAIDSLPARLDGSLLGMTADYISHAFIDLCAAVGIEDLHFHDCRHEAISRLFERGWSVAEVAACSGHRTWSQLKRYTHLKAEDLAKKLA